VREAIAVPCLRKDFIIDKTQIYEACVAGADAILLIVAALRQRQLAELYQAAEICQLDALVEVHTFEELDRALEVGARIIGINNRDLTTLQVDLETTEKISEEVPGRRDSRQRKWIEDSGGRPARVQPADAMRSWWGNR
jgi:indole-3-glycerol phosphate synthase